MARVDVRVGVIVIAKVDVNVGVAVSMVSVGVMVGAHVGCAVGVQLGMTSVAGEGMVGVHVAMIAGVAVTIITQGVDVGSGVLVFLGGLLMIGRPLPPLARVVGWIADPPDDPLLDPPAANLVGVGWDCVGANVGSR